MTPDPDTLHYLLGVGTMVFLVWWFLSCALEKK